MTTRNKNIILVFGLLFTGFLAYKYAISNTLSVKQELETIEQQINSESKSVQSSSQLEKKEANLDSIINKNRSGNASLQNNLLKVLNSFSEKNNFKIISFKEPHYQVLPDSSKITSFNFILEGEYKNIEKTLYQLETNYSFGAVSHSGFQREKDFRLNKNYLRCEVIIQNVQ